MAFDPSFYPMLLTFSAIGFTILISGSTVRYTILRKVPIRRWYFRVFVIISTYLWIPGIMLAFSPIPILWDLLNGSLILSYYGLLIIFSAYFLAFLFIPGGFVFGYAYLRTEEHFMKKFKAELKTKNLEDFPDSSETK